MKNDFFKKPKQNSVVQKRYILKCIILFLNSNYLILSNHTKKKKKSLSVIIKPQLLESIVPMSGQKLYTFPIHPMMFSWSPAAADSSAGVAHQGQCQREFGILLCSFIIQPVLCFCVWEKAELDWARAYLQHDCSSLAMY